MDYYKSYKKDFFNIINNISEWKKGNYISNIFSYLNNMDIFRIEYIFLKAAKCNHCLNPDKKGTKLYSLIISKNKSNVTQNDICDIIENNICMSTAKCRNSKCAINYNYIIISSAGIFIDNF